MIISLRIGVTRADFSAWRERGVPRKGRFSNGFRVKGIYGWFRKSFGLRVNLFMLRCIITAEKILTINVFIQLVEDEIRFW